MKAKITLTIGMGEVKRTYNVLHFTSKGTAREYLKQLATHFKQHGREVREHGDYILVTPIGYRCKIEELHYYKVVRDND